MLMHLDLLSWLSYYLQSLRGLALQNPAGPYNGRAFRFVALAPIGVPTVQEQRRSLWFTRLSSPGC